MGERDPRMHSEPDISAGDRAIVAQVARAHEIDRYLSALLSPRAVRPDLIALAAFAGEISRIPVMVSEPMMGEIRLQWWRDALAAGRGGVRSGNPVTDAFAAAIRRHDLPQALVERVIDSQLALLEPQPFSDEAELRSHLASQDGTLFHLAARMIDRAAAAQAATWIDQAAIAYGLARTAVEFSAVAVQGRTLLPASLAAEFGLEHAAAIARSPEAAERVLARISDLALDAYRDAAGRRRHQPAAPRLACLSLAMVVPYCARVRQLGSRAATEPVEITPFVRVWRLWRWRYGLA